MLWHVLRLSSCLTNCQRREVTRRTGPSKRTYQMWDVDAARSGDGWVVVGWGEVELRRRGVVSQESASQRRPSSACCIPPPLCFLPPSRFLSDIHPLSLFLSPAPLEILVYFDSQTLPSSRDPTLQIYSTYFYQPQNARRQGKQGSESLGFNLLRTPIPPPFSLSLSQSHSLPSPYVKTLCRVSLS